MRMFWQEAMKSEKQDLKKFSTTLAFIYLPNFQILGHVFLASSQMGLFQNGGPKKVRKRKKNSKHATQH